MSTLRTETGILQKTGAVTKTYDDDLNAFINNLQVDTATLNDVRRNKKSVMYVCLYINYLCVIII